jgi:hypothetical protein
VALDNTKIDPEAELKRWQDFLATLPHWVVDIAAQEFWSNLDPK